MLSLKVGDDEPIGGFLRFVDRFEDLLQLDVAVFKEWGRAFIACSRH